MAACDPDPTGECRSQKPAPVPRRLLSSGLHLSQGPYAHDDAGVLCMHALATTITPERDALLQRSSRLQRGPRTARHTHPLPRVPPLTTRMRAPRPAHARNSSPVTRGACLTATLAQSCIFLEGGRWTRQVCPSRRQSVFTVSQVSRRTAGGAALPSSARDWALGRGASCADRSSKWRGGDGWRGEGGEARSNNDGKCLGRLPSGSVILGGSTKCVYSVRGPLTGGTIPPAAQSAPCPSIRPRQCRSSKGANPPTWLVR